MAYVAVVLLQTLILPAIFGVIVAESHTTHALILACGRWFLFWGVGTRLALAGVVQIVKPDFTTSTILEETTGSASLTTRELGFANVAMGAGALIGAFLGGGLAAAVTGGLYMGCAGAGHISRSGVKNSKEMVATWTDLLMFVAMLTYVIELVLVRGQG